MRHLGGAPANREELMEALREARDAGFLDHEAADMIHGVFETAELQVRDIMVPRAQMVVVEREWDLAHLLAQVVDSGHSRYPVVGDSRDEVVGILLAKDLLRVCEGASGDGFQLERVLRKPVFVPESKRVNMLLRDFKRNHQHMAVVADEYGGVAGLVTIEDVLETIVGDIDDEYDDAEIAPILRLDGRRYAVRGDTPIEDFNRYFECAFPDEDFDTVAGLVIHALGRMPRRGESVRIEPFQFNVQRADSRRVQQLQVTRV
jgi:Putative Mg2+ and Co2+ transporter CorC